MRLELALVAALLCAAPPARPADDAQAAPAPAPAAPAPGVDAPLAPSPAASAPAPGDSATPPATPPTATEPAPAAAAPQSAPAPAPTPTPTEALWAPAAGLQGTVVLRSGGTLVGQIVSVSDRSIEVELAGGAGTRARVARDDVVGVRPAEVVLHPPAPFEDAARTRTLHAPTGFLLRSGEVQVSVGELTEATVAVGIWGHLLLSLGAALPTFADEPWSTNLLVEARTGYAPFPFLHLVAGVQATIVPSGSSTATLLAAVSLGTPDLHVTASAGPPMSWSGKAGVTADVVYGLSAGWRFHRRFALVTENWYGDGTHGAEFAESFAVRVLDRRGSLGLGIVHAPGRDTPLPWLDLAVSLDGFFARKEVRP